MSEDNERISGNANVTEQDKELALQAYQEFEKAAYDSCLETLTKLTSSRGQDFKVLLNQAVTEYTKSKFTKTDEFTKALFEASSKAQTNIHQLVGIDDADHCGLFLNRALLLFYQQQYDQALHVAEKIYQTVEPVGNGEVMGKRLLLLLSDLHLQLFHADETLSYLSILEKVIAKDDKDADNIKKQIAIFRSRCYLMQRATKLCKREIKVLQNGSGSVFSVAFLKANLDYVRGNYRKAMKLLSSPTQGQPLPMAQTGECLPMMYNNNLGLLHMYLCKHNLGIFYFKRAIHESQQANMQFPPFEPAKSLSGRSIQTLRLTRHLELLYNTGVQLLHCGKPVQAFECLSETVGQYCTNARLWLRLAECCIQAHQDMVAMTSFEDDTVVVQQAEALQSSSTSRNLVATHSVGSGLHRKLVLEQPTSSGSHEGPLPGMSMSYAATCLRNALALVTKHCDAQSVTEDGQVELKDLPAPPANSINAAEIANLRCSILAASSYVALCLFNPVNALTFAERLAQETRLSAAHRYLAHMYKAEALVALDRISDAIDELSPDQVQDVSVTFPKVTDQRFENSSAEKNNGSNEESEKKDVLVPWTPGDAARARALMVYNLSAAYATRGEFDKSLDHLKTAGLYWKCTKQWTSSGAEFPAQAYYLNIYLELQQGRRNDVQKVL